MRQTERDTEEGKREGSREGKKRERRKYKINPWGSRAGLLLGEVGGSSRMAGRHLFPLYPRMAEEATGSDKMGQKMVDYVTVINPKIMLCARHLKCINHLNLPKSLWDLNPYSDEFKYTESKNVPKVMQSETGRVKIRTRKTGSKNPCT